MFQNSGLSLEQAPPISVILRFFLTGSIWGVVAGVWLMFQGDSSINSNSVNGLILTHIITLGVMLSFMLGALFQMLPVLAGISFKEPIKLAIRSQWPILFGTIFLLLGFFNASSLLYILSIVFLGIGVVPIASLMLRRLLNLNNHSASSRGMGFAIFNLLILFIIGVWMISLIMGWSTRGNILALKQLHIGLGLFGWIALLIISVTFQVIEMFYVTKAYPKEYSNYLPSIITGLLTLELIFTLYIPSFIPYIEEIITPLIAIHALFTLYRLSQRKRPIVDATLWFWRIGMSSLFVAMILWFLDDTTRLSLTKTVIVFYLFFALSIIFAMSYKIVPFLTWFHLNAQGYFNAPMMHEVINPNYAMVHIFIHSTTFTTALISTWFLPTLWHLTGVLLSISFSMIFIAIYRAWHLYIATQKSGERFEFPKGF